jgi:Ser/Thr protein kinase RdoA (MazF antagonist)
MSNRSATITILQHWQQTVGELRDVATMDDNSNIFIVTTQQGDRLILKQVGSIERTAHFESYGRVLRHLHTADVPVALPVLADNHRFLVQHDGDLYTLSPVLPSGMDEGVTIPSEQVYLNLGRAVARMHSALATYQDEILSWRMNFVYRALGEAVPVIQTHLDAQERARFDTVLSDVEQEMRAALADLPEQYIHGDCHGGNIILYNGDVSGFIDLDHLPLGPRIYDVSYFLADRVKSYIETPAELEPWLGYFSHFITGYEQIQPLTAREKAAVWIGMVAVQMIFVEWFFTHDEQAAAHKNLTAFYWIYQHRHAIEPRIIAKGN